MKIAIELKPCPFCGEEPQWINKDGFGHRVTVGIRCDCGMSPSVYRRPRVSEWNSATEELVNQWNHRVLPRRDWILRSIGYLFDLMEELGAEEEETETLCIIKRWIEQA